MYVIKLSWMSGKISGFSRYGSMPGKGEGIAILLESRQSFLDSPGRRVRGQHKLKSAASARSGVGSASTPDQPALDGSVPCSSLDCGHAEAQGAAPDPRRASAAVRRAAVPGDVVPATAPDNPGRGPGRARWIGGWRRGVVILIIPIGAPFPNIAQHIIQSPGIG